MVGPAQPVMAGLDPAILFVPTARRDGFLPNDFGSFYRHSD
jgi:hypothetical protein